MNKRIRVLQTIRQGLVGGGETHVFDLCTHLNKEIFEPIVLSFTEGPMIDKLKSYDIETHVIRSTIPFDLRVSAAIKELLLDKEIDIVHAHGTKAASNTISVAKRLNLPFLYTVHGWSFNDSQSALNNWLRILAEKHITKKATTVICVSESNRATGNSHIKDFAAVVIENGISFDKFSLVNDREAIRNNLGFKNKEIWVGFIARLTFQKDPILLIKAFSQAYKENSNLRLLIVGEGELEKKVNDIISLEGLKKVVKRLPFQDNVPELLTAIDIYTLVSRWEGLPIGLLEAMAMKKACIVSSADGIVEVIDHNKNGIIVNNNNTRELKEAILRFSLNSELRVTFGQKASEKINEKFSLKIMVDKIQKKYLELV